MLANMLLLPDGRGVEFSNEARGRIATSTLEEIRSVGWQVWEVWEVWEDRDLDPRGDQVGWMAGVGGAWEVWEVWEVYAGDVREG